MINNSAKNEIPELCINDFHQGNSGLAIVKLKNLDVELLNKLKTPHRTSCYQIYLVNIGIGFLKLDLQVHHLKARTFCAVPNGVISSIEFNNVIEGYLLFFTEEYLCTGEKDYEWINSLQLFAYLNNAVCVQLSEIHYKELAVLLKRIVVELGLETTFAKDDILSNMVKTFLLISERFIRIKLHKNSFDKGDISILIKFKKGLEENFVICKTVKSYADILCVTPKKLNEVTNRYWGKTAKRIIEERLLLEIKRLLIHTNQTIKEIGSSLGFSEPTNFNKFFKRHLQHTPLEFRESVKNK